MVILDDYKLSHFTLICLIQTDIPNKFLQALHIKPLRENDLKIKGTRFSTLDLFWLMTLCRNAVTLSTQVKL